MNSQIPSILSRSRRRLVVFLIAIALTALALAMILSVTTARGATTLLTYPETDGRNAKTSVHRSFSHLDSTLATITLADRTAFTLHEIVDIANGSCL